MKYLIISGIDGSGKTTIIEHLEKALIQQGFSVDIVWMRYNHYLVKVMNAFARMAGLSVKVNNEMGDVWEHRLYQSPLFCKVYVWCSYIDNLFAKYKVAKLKSDYIICDRWVNDILIDLGAECRIDNILDNVWYTRFHNLLPLHSVEFVIQRNLDELLSCRVENHTNPDFKYRLALYQKLTEKKSIHTINNVRTVAESVQQILDIIDEKK